MSAVAKAAPPIHGAWHARKLAWMPLLCGLSLAAACAALLTGALLGEPQSIATAAIGLVVVLAIVHFAFRGEERQFLRTVLLVAFSARIVAAVVSHFLLVQRGMGGFILLDDRAYDKLGWTVARSWMGLLPGIRDTDQYLMVNYTYLIGVVYYLLGHSLLAAKMLNVAFGTLTGLVSYAIGREILDRRSARLAALLTVFFPSLLAWSVFNFKDILVVLLTLSTIFGLLRYARGHHWWALGLTLLAFWSIENLRQFVFFILAWLLPLGFFFADRSRLRLKLALLLPLLAGILVISFLTHNPNLGMKWLTPNALSAAEYSRWLAERNAQTGIDEDTPRPPKDNAGAPLRAIQYLPKGIYYVLLGPLPWEAKSTLAQVVIPEMLAWYALLLAAAIGLAMTFRRSWRDLVLPLGFSAGWIVALALTEGNTGNIYRHRGMFMPLLFLLSAVGMNWFWMRLRASRPTERTV